jgi:16S rRNA (guanine527-N7)-methyltransferase
MELITTHFPDLTEEQKAQFAMLDPLYREWNERINVISRKDIDELYLHHVLHSLAIAKVVAFKPNTTIIDLGTGGGFPGIPLAILFPEVEFILSDSIRKKITVVEEISLALGLQNVQTVNKRTEELKVKADFVVSRAVAPLEKLVYWSRRLINTKHINAYPNGLICLKGGNLKSEIAALGKEKRYVDTFEVNDFFKNEYYNEKSVVYMPL